MKKHISIAFLAIFSLAVTSCRNDSSEPMRTPGKYENGILIVNEGKPDTPVAEVDFLSNQSNTLQSSIYKAENNTSLGNILQDIGFKNDNAYLVLNIPNKIEVVNRYDFKKIKTISEKVDNARYIAFAEGKTFVTCQDFYTFRKINIYGTNDEFKKEISLPRYAEKVVSAGGKIYIQSDGVTYPAPNYVPTSTGNTISVLNPITENIESTLTVTSGEIIQDLEVYADRAYVLTSTATGSSFYSISPTGNTITKTSLPDIAGANDLSIDNNIVYIKNDANFIFKANLGTVQSISSWMNLGTTGYVYGMNVIENNLYVSLPNSLGLSVTKVYDVNTKALKNTLSNGYFTSKFFKN